MKFQVTMKTPDALHYATHTKAFGDMEENEEADEAYEFCADHWFKYGEYLTVEVDTVAGTCIVLSLK